MNAPDIDPIALSLGPVKIHWYGLMYVAAFLLVWWLAARRAARPGSGWTRDEVSDLIFYGALGVVLGGRLGYILFYNFNVYLHDPLAILRVWEGGMSFHGGLLGVIAAMVYFARRTGKTFLAVADVLALWTPIGLGLGRLGNFINHELWGSVTTLPWGMVFRHGGPDPRHPTQLYEFALEGALLLAILLVYARRPRPAGAIAGLFLAGYGVFRFLIEFVREPDVQLGYLAWDWLTMGQVLSLPMVLGGIGLMVFAQRRG